MSKWIKADDENLTKSKKIEDLTHDEKATYYNKVGKAMCDIDSVLLEVEMSREDWKSLSTDLYNIRMKIKEVLGLT